MAIFVVYLGLLVPLTKDEPQSQNDRARIAEIEAIVERGTFAIDESVYDTHDKITARGNFYSNKPPMLSVLASGVYWVQYHALGWSLRSSPRAVYYWTTLLTIGVASALLIACFYIALGLWPMAERLRVALTAMLGLATLVLPYSTVLNNHTFTATLVFVAFYLLAYARAGSFVTRGRLAGAGFLSALAASIDVVAGGAFLVGSLAYVLLSKPLRKHVWWFAAAALPPVVAFFAFNYAIVESLVPPYSNPAFYQYQGSVLNTPEEVYGAITVLHPVLVAQRAMVVLFRNHGFLSITPLLYVPVLALGYTLIERRKLFPEALLVGWVSFATLAFYLTKAHYPAGSFGFRYLIPLVPLLLFFTPMAIARNTRLSFYLALAGIYSAGMAAWGTLDPWRGIDLGDQVIRLFFNLNYLLVFVLAGLLAWQWARGPRVRQEETR